MQNITREAVEKLLETNQPSPAVTMYIPMHTSASPPHITENQIRLKNLISKAADEIRAHDEASKLGKELQQMLDSVYDDLSFWEQQTAGMLVCARPGNIQMFHLPMDTDEYLAIDETFHLAPVLAILNENHPYYVLTVEQHNPKLFKGDMYGLRFSDISLPETVQAALNLDEQNQKSENQGAASGSSVNTSGFNGRGGARNPQEEDRLKFFRIVDKIVCSSDLQGLPLILAGIDAETVEYRNLSKYPKILKGTINGSHADLDMDRLFKKARRIVEKELVMPVHAAAIEEYERLEGANPGRTARDMKAIQEAIDQGRVDKLLASMSNRTTDTVQDSLKDVAKITFPDAKQSKTLNRLAMKVWQMSGTVINLTPHEMPHGAPMVARLRY
jgi:hypothetical protein